MKRYTAAAISLCVLFSAGLANAFERTTTCYLDDDSPFPCDEGEEPIPIYWPRSCVAYHIHEDGFDAVSDDELVEIVDRSFERWNQDCSYLRLSYGGRTDERRVGYDGCGGESGNANVVSFVTEGWTHAPRAVALTSVTYSTRTGRIYDTDVEMNADRYNLGVVPEGACDRPASEGICAVTDIENTLTHEVGHVVGLDHTLPETFISGGDGEAYNAATMYAETVAGETHKRELLHDDVQGVCAIYPIAEDAPECVIRNEGYFVAPSRAYDDPCPREGCGCTQTPTPANGLLHASFALLALLARRRRRVRRAR